MYKILAATNTEDGISDRITSSNPTVKSKSPRHPDTAGPKVLSFWHAMSSIAQSLQQSDGKTKTKVRQTMD